jgi:hypothetical protein
VVVDDATLTCCCSSTGSGGSDERGEDGKIGIDESGRKLDERPYVRLIVGRRKGDDEGGEEDIAERK